MTLKELRERRQKLLADVDAISRKAETEKRRLTSEEMQSATRMLDEADELKPKIQELEDEARLNDRVKAAADELRDGRGRRKTDAGQPGEGARGEERDGGFDRAKRYADVFAKYLRRGENRMTPEELDILDGGFVRDPSPALTPGDESRGQTVGTNADGGFTVAPLFSGLMTDAMKLYQSIRNAGSDHIVTDTGASLPFPTNDDTGNAAAIVAEEADSGSASVTFGNKPIPTYKYGTGEVMVSLELLQDSAFPLETWLAGKLGMRMGRGVNAHWTTGTGTGQPEGIVTGIGTVAGTGVVNTAANNAFTIDEIVTLYHAVDPAYRASAVFMMSDGIALRCKLLKDSYGRPLLTDYAQGGEMRILGKPVAICTDMQATIAASRTLILFGDPKFYKTREVRNSMTIYRRGEVNIHKGQIGFLAFARYGGAYVNPGNGPIRGLRTIA